MTNDLLNGVFEGGGAVLLFLNVRRILRDKSVAGVSLLPVVWWTAWGFWNLYYYPSLGQWASFAGGCGVVLLNTVWLSLAYHYWRKARRNGNF